LILACVYFIAIHVNSIVSLLYPLIGSVIKVFLKGSQNCLNLKDIHLSLCPRQMQQEKFSVLAGGSIILEEDWYYGQE
jgi:hypothetical protein